MPEVEELGSRDAIESIRDDFEDGDGGGSAAEGLRRDQGDLKAVVDYMAEETKAGLFEPAAETQSVA